MWMQPPPRPIKRIKIIQMMPMPNNEYWQGVVLGLGDDGVVYIDSGHRSWEVYIPLKFKWEEY